MRLTKKQFLSLFIFILVLSICEMSFAYSVKSERPKIWINSSDLMTDRNLIARTKNGGSHYEAYSYILSWCDSHLNDDISSISQNSDYNWAGDNNMAIHLFRFSLIYQITKNNTYGDRVRDLLYYLASNGTTDFSRTINAGDGYTLSAPAISIGYDWCYDRIKGSYTQAAIESYLADLVNSSATYCVPGKVTYKTEEPWYGAFLAMAIYGEGIADSACSSILTNFKTWVESYIGHYDSAGYMGGTPFLGTYVMIQFSHHFASFAELWRSATDEDWWNETNGTYTPPSGFAFPGSEFARNLYKKSVLDARPGLMGQKNGDSNIADYSVSGPMYAEYSWAFSWNYKDPVAKYWGDLIQELNPNYNTVSWTVNRIPHYFFKILWFDETLNGTINGQSKYNFWQGTNKVTFRNGFNFSKTSSDIGGHFSVSKKHSYVHWHADQGHISLWRGIDSLLIDSGYYAYYDNPQYNNYFTTPAAHNVIIINNENFKFANSNSGYTGYDNSISPQEPANDLGSIVAFDKSEDEFIYSKGDITKAYIDNRVNSVTRSMSFVNNKYLVVLDRTNVIDSNYTQKLLWHTAGEPKANGTGWTSTPGYIDVSTDTNSVSWVNNNSQGYYDMLAPSSGVLFRKVGGSGYEYCDLSYTQQGAKSEFDSGSWRFEVTPLVKSNTVNFLSVIQAKGAGESKTPSLLLENIDDSHIGAVIEDEKAKNIVIYSNREDKTDSCSFSYNTTSAVRILFCDLTEGTYQVLRNSVVIDNYEAVVVDKNGTLFVDTEFYGDSTIQIIREGFEKAPGSVPSTPENLRIQ